MNDIESGADAAKRFCVNRSLRHSNILLSVLRVWIALNRPSSASFSTFSVFSNIHTVLQRTSVILRWNFHHSIWLLAPALYNDLSVITNKWKVLLHCFLNVTILCTHFFLSILTTQNLMTKFDNWMVDNRKIKIWTKSELWTRVGGLLSP